MRVKHITCDKPKFCKYALLCFKRVEFTVAKDKIEIIVFIKSAYKVNNIRLIDEILELMIYKKWIPFGLTPSCYSCAKKPPLMINIVFPLK